MNSKDWLKTRVFGLGVEAAPLALEVHSDRRSEA